MNLNDQSATRPNFRASIKDWIGSYIAELMGIPKEQIEDHLGFADYGLDSTAAAGLSGDLSDWLGFHLEANITQRYPTIEQLTEQVFRLATIQGEKRSGALEDPHSSMARSSK